MHKSIIPVAAMALAIGLCVAATPNDLYASEQVPGAEELDGSQSWILVLIRKVSGQKKYTNIVLKRG